MKITGPHSPHRRTSTLTSWGSSNHSECAISSQIEPTTMITMIAIFITFISVELPAARWLPGSPLGVTAALTLTDIRRKQCATRLCERVCERIAMLLKSAKSQPADHQRNTSMNELADKVAIITGGGYGIGKQIALLYGKAGAKIVIAARSVDPMKQTCAELERAGTRAIHVTTDVSKEPDCAKMIDAAMKAFGRVDILVNNAGISGPTKRITEMSLAEWQGMRDIHTDAHGLGTRRAPAV